MKQPEQQVGTPPGWHLDKYRVHIWRRSEGCNLPTTPGSLSHTYTQNLPATHRLSGHQPCSNRILSWWTGWTVLRTRVGRKYGYCANIDEYHSPWDLRLASAPLNLKYTWHRLPHCLKKNPSFLEILKSCQERIAKDGAGALTTTQTQAPPPF